MSLFCLAVSKQGIHNVYGNTDNTGFTSSFHIVINMMLNVNVATVIIKRL